METRTRSDTARRFEPDPVRSSSIPCANEGVAISSKSMESVFMAKLRSRVGAKHFTRHATHKYLIFFHFQRGRHSTFDRTQRSLLPPPRRLRAHRLVLALRVVRRPRRIRLARGLLARRQLEQRVQRAARLVDARVRIADAREPLRHRLQGELGGIDR